MKKTDLRQQAEAKLSKRKKSPAMDANQRLIYELQVHQIELEMQNEELVQARAEAEAVHRQYVDLYDFAPLGYFTLTRDGTIQRSNLTGARLLGAERSKLAKHRFGVFVSIESRPAFSAFLEKIFTTENNESCEIMLLKEGHASFWVHLDAVCSEDRLECRVVMKDITERRQAEMELKESERQLREKNLDLNRAESEAHIGNWKWNLKTATVEWSDEMFRIFGIDQDSYTGRLGDVISKVIHPDDLHIVLPSNASAFASNQPQEYRIVRPTDGAVRHIWVKAGETILDEQGNPLFLTGVAQDITERKRAEELIKATNDFLQIIDKFSGLAIFVAKVLGEGKYEYEGINDTYEMVFGLKRDDIVGRTPSDLEYFFGKEIVQYVYSIYGQCVRTKEPNESESEVKMKDGTKAWWLSRLTPQLDDQGRVCRIIGTSQNITQRKLAEDALAESETKFRNLFETMSDGIVYEDHNGKITSANPAAERLLGLSFEQMQGRTSVDPRWKAIHADGSPFPGETHSLHVAATTGKPASDEVMGIYNPKLNAYVWLSVNSTPEFLPGEKKPFRAYAVFRDITERKQIEDTLMFLLRSGYQDEDFFHSLARYLTSSLSMDYVCIDRLAGDQLSAQTLAVYFDGKFDDNVSYTLKDTPCGDVVGKAVCIFPSQVRHLFPLDAVLQEMPAESYVGSTLWSSQGTPIGLIAVIGRNPLSAASQRMAESILKLVAVRAAGELEGLQAEEEIRQLNVNLEQRVEERTRELRDAQEKLVRQGKLTVMGELAGSVGHELRNPLSVINSAIYYLKMVQPDATDEMKQYLDMIGQEVWNAEKIIDNLLDFGRAISADLEVVPVSELVDQTLEKLALLESVKVTLDIPTDLPKVYVDPRQMRQVFGNLIVNACQAMTATSGAGGKLTISAVLQGGMVRVDICDNGIGIPSENLHKIFDPLFTTKAKGIGLGLALSKKLIEANHARIEVESEAGKGSTFIVYLPVYEKLKTRT